jgi:hypothetical protein
MAPQAKRAVPSAAANGKNGHTLISDVKFRQLYGLALKLHVFAQNGEVSAYGHDAALAGVVADLHESDVLIARCQPQIATLLHAGAPQALKCTAGQAGSDLNERIVESVSGSVADRMRKNGRVTVVYLPGAEVSAMLNEARQLAERARLPILFVEEFQSELKPARGSRSNKDAESVYMPGIPVDAGDVIAMYRVSHESIARARQGGGPTRILCVTEPDAVGRKRPPHRSGSAVSSLESWLIARGLPAQEWRHQIDLELGQQAVSR